MKFKNMVAVIAIVCMASEAHAASGGSLRRAKTITQTEQIEKEIAQAEKTAVDVVKAEALTQPATVVEAAPEVDSRAEVLRKARQGAELKTEQKIVEKLEEERLKEEQERAQRLFGETLDLNEKSNVAPQTPVVVPAATPVVAAPAAAPAVTPTIAPTPVKQAPVATTPAVVEAAPVVTIIEDNKLVEPAKQDKIEAIEKAEKSVVAESSLNLEQVVAPEEIKKDQIYASAIIGAVSYSAGNVRSNGAIGVAAGLNFNPAWSIEGSYLYSSNSIDTFWQPNLYRDLDQHSLGLAAKYNFQVGRFKPYAGASVTYIYRHYSDRIVNNQAFFVNNFTSNEDTQALNFGIMGGGEVELTKKILVGAGFEWSTNIANNSGFQFSNYGLPDNTKSLEDMDFLVLKVTAKFLF